MFSFCTLRTNRTLVHKRTLKKKTKQLTIEKKRTTRKCRAKQTQMNMATLKASLERLPQKTKIFLAFYDGFAKSSARDEKWIQSTECLLWAHVECYETPMYVCE